MDISFLEIFKKYKKFIILFVAGVTIIAGVVVYNSPPLYQASAKIYPKEFDNIKILYEAIKTEEILNAVIDDTSLIEIFGVKNQDEARRKLTSLLKVILDSRNNVIEIKIRWEHPDEAVLIVNSFLKKLQENYPSPLDSARTKSKITEYENAFNSAQQRKYALKEKEKGLFSDDSLPVKIATQIGQLKGDIAIKEEILLAFNQATSTPPKFAVFENILTDQRKLRSLYDKLDNYLISNTGDNKTGEYFYLKSLEGLEAESAIYSNLLNRALIEKNQSLNWQILQKPSISEEPIGPNKTKVFFYAALLSFLIAVFLSFLLEIFRKKN